MIVPERITERFLEPTEGLLDEVPPLPPGVAQADAAEPAIIYLWYADGTAPPSGTCRGTPPAWTCSYGTLDECKRQVQAILDRYYADFNVVFTLQKPTAATYYTMIVTNSGQWCNQGGLGVAPWNGCTPKTKGGTAYAFSGCGKSGNPETPHKCATTIAQEQAHLVALAHTNTNDDVMHPSYNGKEAGFADVASATNPNCGTQNPYRLMLERLGAWPGGPKPGPFGDVTGGAPKPNGGASGSAGQGGASGGSPGAGGAGPMGAGGTSGGTPASGGRAGGPPGAAGSSGAPSGGQPGGGAGTSGNQGQGGGSAAGSAAGAAGGGRAGGAGSGTAGTGGSSGSGDAGGTGKQDEVGGCALGGAGGASSHGTLLLVAAALGAWRRAGRRGRSRRS